MGPPPVVEDPNMEVVQLFDNLAIVKEDDVIKVKIAADKQLGLKFRSNPSTGFKWMVEDHDNSCIENLETKYRMDDSGYPLAGQGQLMGVGGQSTLVFKPKAEAGCTQDLTLAYAQPWNFPGFDRANSLTKVQVKVMPAESDIKRFQFEDYVMSADKVVNMEISAGKWFAIDFKSNRTTGFRWHMAEQEGNNCVTLFDSTYETDASKYTTGVGGQRSMLFEFGQAGCEETLYLNYARSWMFKNGFNLSEDNLARNPYTKVNIKITP